MIVLIFVSYKAQIADRTWIQGSHTCTLTMADPSDFSIQFNELLEIIKTHHNSNNVIFENVAMQEWRNNND